MISSGRFSIQLKEPWTWEGLTPPEDQLGELTDVEMGLQRFCFECNRRVTIEIGDEHFDVYLDPDIILILDKLPERLSQIKCGIKISIELPESYREIIFVPANNAITCIVRKFGQKKKSKQISLDRDCVIKVLQHFLHEIIQLAVERGYINLNQADEFLAASG